MLVDFPIDIAVTEVEFKTSGGNVVRVYCCGQCGTMRVSQAFSWYLKCLSCSTKTKTFLASRVDAISVDSNSKLAVVSHGIGATVIRKSL